jgi:Lrp/AsnC family leucine-responsive transcriptional regulator
VGVSILAYLWLRYPSSINEPLHELLRETPEVIEAHHVTGDDCVIMKFVETSAAADTTELSFGRWHYNKG